MRAVWDLASDMYIPHVYHGDKIPWVIYIEYLEKQRGKNDIEERPSVNVWLMRLTQKYTKEITISQKKERKVIPICNTGISR